MPKTLVLYHAATDALAREADTIADGARSVRFTEVDVRRVGGGGKAGDTPHSEFGPTDRIDDYDAVIVGGAADDPALDALFASIAGAHLHDPVGTAFTTGDDPWPLLRRLGPRFLIVPPRTDGNLEKLGAKVATVAGWVRHVRSHEH